MTWGPSDEQKHPRDRAGRWAEKLSDLIGQRRYRGMLADLAAMSADTPAHRQQGVAARRETAEWLRGRLSDPEFGHATIPVGVGVLLDLADEVTDGEWEVAPEWGSGEPSGVIRRVYSGGPGAGSLRIETDGGNLDFPIPEPWSRGEEVRIQRAFRG